MGVLVVLVYVMIKLVRLNVVYHVVKVLIVVRVCVIDNVLPDVDHLLLLVSDVTLLLVRPQAEIYFILLFTYILS